MTGYGKRGRPQTATTDERKFRSILREYGFRPEAIPWIRQRDEAHTAIVVYPVKDIGDVVELFTRHTHTRYVPVEITRIHIPKENKYGQPACRVYFRWMKVEEAVLDGS